MTGTELYSIIKKNKGMGGSKPRAYCKMTGGAWCCAYVCYSFNQGGVKNLFYGGKKVTYCPTAIKWCEANLAQIPLYLAMPCDIIFFDWQPNGTPDHIGFVKHRISTTEIETHEGNTSGGIVDEKTRKAGKNCKMWVFRPHFTPAKAIKKHKISEDGDFGYNSIWHLQLALGIKTDGVLGKATVRAIQKKVGVAQDGAWGAKTSKAVQSKLCGFTGKAIDGEFGNKSVTALQKWINKVNFPSATKPSTVTKPTTPQPSAQATKAVAWGKSIVKGGKYKYKKFNNKDKKTKQCPICHHLTGKYKGWNCIGYVSACFFHSGLKQIKCACNGIGTDGFFTKVTLNTWTQRNGKGWQMIGSGSKGGADIPASQLIAGDVLICYDGNGKFKHIALYAGNGKILESTKTRKPNVGERTYKDLCSRHHVTRAFRYVG